jgi:protein phosphatase-4 regulatory subunit 3
MANHFYTQDEARIHVQSEDEPDRTLLETRITKDDGYQKQQGMITKLEWQTPCDKC